MNLFNLLTRLYWILSMGMSWEEVQDGILWRWLPWLLTLVVPLLQIAEVYLIRLVSHWNLILMVFGHFYLKASLSHFSLLWATARKQPYHSHAQCVTFWYMINMQINNTRHLSTKKLCNMNKELKCRFSLKLMDLTDVWWFLLQKRKIKCWKRDMQYLITMENFMK